MLSQLGTILSNLQTQLTTGTIPTSALAIAIAVTGLLCAFGYISFRLFAGVLLGGAVIGMAATVASTLI